MLRYLQWFGRKTFLSHYYVLSYKYYKKNSTLLSKYLLKLVLQFKIINNLFDIISYTRSWKTYILVDLFCTLNNVCCCKHVVLSEFHYVAFPWYRSPVQLQCCIIRTRTIKRVVCNTVTYVSSRKYGKITIERMIIKF